MDSQIIIAAFAALGASLLTFFTVFGLGTILLPVLAVFLPLAGQGKNLMIPITFAAAASALPGTILGSKLLKKVEIRQIEILASVMLLAVSLALAFGYI